MRMDSLDVMYAVKELRLLHGAKVEKVLEHDAEKRDFCITMYLKDWPKLHLRLMPGLLCLQDEKPGHYPKTPPGFAMFLRKYIGGARLIDARQRGFDRIVELDFESKHGRSTLVIELIPPGNVLLLMKGKIKGLLENQHYKDRNLRGGIPYEPPQATFDPASIDDAALAAMITASTKRSIVTSLAMDVGLGGVYAEEACARVGVEKGRADLTQAEVAKVVGAVRELFAQEIAPCKDAARAYPFMMRSREIAPAEQKLYIAALGAFIENVPAVAKQQAKQPKDKLAVMLEAQEKQIRKFEKEMEESQRAGERIYEEYQSLQEIIAIAQKAREERRDVLDALKAYASVKGYDPATGELEVDL